MNRENYLADVFNTNELKKVVKNTSNWLTNKVYNINRLLVGVILIIGFFQSIRGTNYEATPTPGKISIVASTPIPPGVVSTRQSYIDLIDCGFNLGMEMGTIQYFQREFELLKGLNFKYLISNHILRTPERVSIIEAFKDEPNFAGWNFWDEPHYDDLPILAEKYKELYDAYSKKLIYINQAAVVNKVFTGPYTNFGDFLIYYNKLINPEIWSFDYYPIITRNGKTICEVEQFYYALESFREIAKTTSKPFWSYCECMQYQTNTYSRPVATEAYLRYEAFSALAYGAQGIVYWTYGQRKSNAAEDYLSALVNLNGKKTSAWKAAKKVNGEIKKFNDVFYGCKVTDLRHTGDRIYKGTRKLSGEFGPFQMIRSKEAGVVASYIENNGNRYVVLVNRDPFNKQKVSLELKANNNILDISSSSKPKEHSWRKDINITLNKGGYVIFKEL